MSGTGARGALATLALSSLVLVAVVLAGMMSMPTIGTTGTPPPEDRRSDPYAIVGGVVIPPSEAPVDGGEGPVGPQGPRGDIIVAGGPTGPDAAPVPGSPDVLPGPGGPGGPATGPGGTGRPGTGGPGPGPGGPLEPTPDDPGPVGPTEPVDPTPDPEPTAVPTAEPTPRPTPPSPDRPVAGGPPFVTPRRSPWPPNFTVAKGGPADGDDGGGDRPRVRVPRGDRGDRGDRGRGNGPIIIVKKPQGNRDGGPQWRPGEPARQTHPHDASKWSRVGPRTRPGSEAPSGSPRASNGGGRRAPSPSASQPRRKSPVVHQAPASQRGVVPSRPRVTKNDGGNKNRASNHPGRGSAGERGRRRGQGRGRRR